MRIQTPTVAAVLATAGILIAGCGTSPSHAVQARPDVSRSTAATTASVTAADTVGLPAPDGPDSVGVVDLQRFGLAAYYPARPGTGRGPRPYAGLALLGRYGLTPDDLSAISGSAQIGAQPLDERRRRPVVVLAPGGASFVDLSTSLAESLASHGYVVITVQPDAGVEAGLTLGTPPTDPHDTQLLQKAGDSARAAQLTQALDLVDDPLTAELVGPLDRSRIAVGGHSIGGSYAFDLSLVDHRVSAVFDLDGSFFGPAATAPMRVPALVVMADFYAIAQGVVSPDGPTGDTARATLKRLTTDKSIVSVAIADARHYDVTDLPAIFAQLPEAVRADVMTGAGTVGRAGTTTTNTIVRRFLDAALARHPRLARSDELASGLGAARVFPAR